MIQECPQTTEKCALVYNDINNLLFNETFSSPSFLSSSRSHFLINSPLSRSSSIYLYRPNHPSDTLPMSSTTLLLSKNKTSYQCGRNCNNRYCNLTYQYPSRRSTHPSKSNNSSIQSNKQIAKTSVTKSSQPMRVNTSVLVNDSPLSPLSIISEDSNITHKSHIQNNKSRDPTSESVPVKFRDYNSFFSQNSNINNNSSRVGSPVALDRRLYTIAETSYDDDDNDHSASSASGPQFHMLKSFQATNTKSENVNNATKLVHPTAHSTPNKASTQGKNLPDLSVSYNLDKSDLKFGSKNIALFLSKPLELMLLLTLSKASSIPRTTSFISQHNYESYKLLHGIKQTVEITFKNLKYVSISNVNVNGLNTTVIASLVPLATIGWFYLMRKYADHINDIIIFGGAIIVNHIINEVLWKIHYGFGMLLSKTESKLVEQCASRPNFSKIDKGVETGQKIIPASPTSTFHKVNKKDYKEDDCYGDEDDNNLLSFHYKVKEGFKFKINSKIIWSKALDVTFCLSWITSGLLSCLSPIFYSSILIVARSRMIYGSALLADSLIWLYCVAMFAYSLSKISKQPMLSQEHLVVGNKNANESFEVKSKSKQVESIHNDRPVIFVNNENDRYSYDSIMKELAQYKNVTYKLDAIQRNIPQLQRSIQEIAGRLVANENIWEQEIDILWKQYKKLEEVSKLNNQNETDLSNTRGGGTTNIPQKSQSAYSNNSSGTSSRYFSTQGSPATNSSESTTVFTNGTKPNHRNETYNTNKKIKSSSLRHVTILSAPISVEKISEGKVTEVIDGRDTMPTFQYQPYPIINESKADTKKPWPNASSDTCKRLKPAFSTMTDSEVKAISVDNYERDYYLIANKFNSKNTINASSSSTITKMNVNHSLIKFIIRIIFLPLVVGVKVACFPFKVYYKVRELARKLV